jgi:hypothetical protein
VGSHGEEFSGRPVYAEGTVKIPSELLLLAKDPLMGPALLRFINDVKTLEETGQGLADAVQRFRNLPKLRKSALRNTDQYSGLCNAWDKWRDLTGVQLPLTDIPAKTEMIDIPNLCILGQNGHTSLCVRQEGHSLSRWLPLRLVTLNYALHNGGAWEPGFIHTVRMPVSLAKENHFF